MEKKIVRTFKSWEITIKDALKENEILKNEIVFDKPKKEKIASKFVKETGNTCFLINIIELEDKREISYEDFMKYSNPVKED